MKLSPEAEAEIERLAEKDWELHDGPPYSAVVDNLRAAMVWAYRDAASRAETAAGRPRRVYF